MQIKKLQSIMAGLQSEQDKIKGAVIGAKEAVIQKYGVYEKITLKCNYDEFIEQKQKAAVTIDTKIAAMKISVNMQNRQ